MPTFRPQRQFGQWLLRALGAQELLTGRTITQLEWESTVLPVVDVSQTSGFPGLTGTPQREVWIASGQIDAVIAAHAVLKVWAAPNTFSTQDPREAAGIWILNWEMKLTSGGSFPAGVIRMGVVAIPETDPGQGAGAGNVILNGVGGGLLNASPAHAALAGRSPRAQVNMAVSAAFDAGLPRYPSRTATSAPSILGPYPYIYVPPGHSFRLDSTVDFEDCVFTVWYVEAEEPPVAPVFP